MAESAEFSLGGVKARAAQSFAFKPIESTGLTHKVQLDQCELCCIQGVRYSFAIKRWAPLGRRGQQGSGMVKGQWKCVAVYHGVP